MKKQFIFSALFLSVLFLNAASCSSDTNVKPVIENYADIALATYEDALTDAKEMDQAINEFVENPSESTLQAAKDAWLSARETYGQTEAFRFYGGPIDDEDGPEARLAYLNLLTEALTQHSATILEEWNSGYAEEFIGKTGNEADSGITLLANEMGYILQKVRMEKLEIPFGARTEGTQRPQMLESVYANISKELIRENLISAQQRFNGGEGNGFDDYISALGIEDENGELLSEPINREYKHAFQILDSINGSLEDAIINQKSTAQELIDSINRLYIYTDIDMISQLGILTVFSDNDGD